MVEEEPFDVGGMKLDLSDCLSDDLIGKIKGLNPELGSKSDPLYDRYAAYRDEIENAELIVIDANVLNRSSIMNLDLTGDTSGVHDLEPSFFQLIGDTLSYAFGHETSLSDFENPDEGMEEYCNWGETEYTPFSDGEYI